MLTLDEIVARNVRRIREARGLSRSDLASKLNVGLHVVRDYERPRAGQPQRQFLWSELVALCGALGTTLFELVLPAEGVKVDMAGLGGIPDRVVPVGRGRDDLGPFQVSVKEYGREGLSFTVFGVYMDKRETLESKLRRLADESAATMRELRAMREEQE